MDVILLNKIITYIKKTNPKLKHMIKIYIFIMMILSIMIFSLTLHYGYVITSTSKYSYIKPSAQWFFNETQNIDSIYSDHHTQGQYSIIGAELNLTFKPEVFYTEDSYKHLVDINYTITNNLFFTDKYVILNLKLANKKTTAGGWKDLEQLNNHLENINNNLNLNMIYNDGNMSILYGKKL